MLRTSGYSQPAMSVDTVTTFFALLAVLGIVFLLIVAGLGLFATATGGASPSLREYRDSLGSLGLLLGFAVALTCTLGSLYLSEVAKFPPCELCWFQRIAMYPLTVIMGVAALRRDYKVAFYSVPIAVVGLGISIYHYLVERFPDDVGFACNTEVPCSTVWVWKFHFLSIPAMAGVGFLLVSTLSMIALKTNNPNREI